VFVTNITEAPFAPRGATQGPYPEPAQSSAYCARTGQLLAVAPEPQNVAGFTASGAPLQVVEAVGAPFEVGAAGQTAPPKRNHGVCPETS
jgi:hypothetical protein